MFLVHRFLAKELTSSGTDSVQILDILIIIIIIIIQIDGMFFNFQLSSLMTEKLEGPEGLDSSLLLMKIVHNMAWKWINRLVTDMLQKYIRKCKA